jgi:hypothetical protein
MIQKNCTWNTYEKEHVKRFAYEADNVMPMTDRDAWETNAKALFNKISKQSNKLILEAMR